MECKMLLHITNNTDIEQLSKWINNNCSCNFCKTHDETFNILILNYKYNYKKKIINEISQIDTIMGYNITKTIREKLFILQKHNIINNSFNNII